MKNIVWLAVALAFGISSLATAQSQTPPTSEDTPAFPHEAVPAGPYMKTCKDPMIRDGILYATCQQPNKTRRQTKLQMPCPGKIENKDGTLVCAK